MKQDKQWQRFIPLSLLVIMFFCPAISMAGQDITTSWTHSKNKDEASENTYSITYSLELQQEITETMSLQESFRSSSGWYEEEDNHNIDPSVRFTVNNDLFLLELYGSGSHKRYSNTDNQKQTNAEAVWSSTWDKRFWPNLRTSYGRDWREDDASPTLTDSETTSSSFAVDWDLEIFKLYYNYNDNEFSDLVTGAENTTTNNFARLEADHSFWQNRLNIGFSHQYSENNYDSVTSIGTSGTALILQNLSQVLHGLDATPLTTAAELTPVAALHDGDLVTASSVSTDGLDNPPHNIAVKVDFKTIDTIYLYTTTDQSANSGGFSFSLYTSDNGSNWQLATASQPFNYNNAENRFELPISSLSHLWLKVVITASPLVSIDFAEVETYQSVTASGEYKQSSTSKNSITDFNLNFLLTTTVSLSYNLSVEDGQYSSGVDYDRYNHTGQLQWQPDPSLTTTLGFNESTKQNGDAKESKTRAYTINMDALPLDTLDVNMGLSRSEEYEGAERQSIDYNFGMLTTAALYPDLDASIDFNYGHLSHDITNLTTRDYHTTLTLTARLVPSLTADLSSTYQETLGSAGYTTTDTILNLNWRTSDMMSMHLSGKKEWIDSQSESEGGSLSMSVAPTDTTQFSFSYIYDNNSERIDKYSVFASWSLGPHFTLQGNGNYSESETEEEWQVQSQLVARFSIL